MSTEVKPIPDGFSTVTPHLVIKNASEAIEFYKKAFNAVELCRMPGPDGTNVMHAEIRIGASVIMIADEFPDYGLVGPTSLGGSPVSIHLYVDNVDEQYQQAIAAGGTAIMPVTDAFWGDRYGKLTDPYGHQWSIATHTEDLTPEQIAERAAAQFSGAGACES